MRQTPRGKRLVADHDSLLQLQTDSSIFSYSSRGNPPERYEIRFHGIGLWRLPTGDVVLRDEHELRIELGAAYPRMMPALHWKTPIFHPNISTAGVVCLGGYGTHWVPSLKLDELCHMLWDMIRMKNFDIKSPYNREAAFWVHEQRRYRFPLDARSLRDRITGETLVAAQRAPVYNVVPPPVQESPRRRSLIPRFVESLTRRTTTSSPGQSVPQPSSPQPPRAPIARTVPTSTVPSPTADRAVPPTAPIRPVATVPASSVPASSDSRPLRNGPPPVQPLVATDPDSRQDEIIFIE